MKQKIYISLAALALLAAGCNAKVQKNEEVNTTKQAEQQEQTQNKEVASSDQTKDQTSQPHFSDGTDVEAVPTPEVLEIKMTADGFVPQSITIQKGDYVQFTNTDSNPHWPASDPHPIHTGLPGFDSLKGIVSGSYFRYQFMEAGTFGFHDHLHASLKGSVVVK